MAEVKRQNYDFVIIGAGPAGVTAAETLAKHSKDKTILLIGGEAEPPYSRMAIPYLLHESINEEGTYLRRSSDHYDGQGINYINALVAKLDEDEKALHLANGGVIGFEKLLIASGSHPVRPPIDGLDHDKVQHCWTLEDSRHIAKHAKAGSKVVLMGAGFIGCIILEALAARKVDLSVVEMGSRMVPRMLDEACGTLLKDWCEDKGVDIHLGTKITKIEHDEDRLMIYLDGGDKLPADLLVVAAGVAPNIDFLKDTNIEIGQGIRVDDKMRTNQPDIYAAGDVAEAKDFSTDSWSVQAIQPVAADHGKIAALNMMGIITKFDGSLAMNVLDTMGLISTSFGKWDGVDDGETAIRLDRDRFRYTRLEFSDDILIGAQTLGRTNHVGVLRGLIANKMKLGAWKDKLMDDPNLIMDAYIDLSHPS